VLTIEHRKAAGEFGALFKWSNLAEGLNYDPAIHFERLQALKANKGLYVPPPQIAKPLAAIQPVAVDVAPVETPDVAALVIALNEPQEGEWTQEQIDAAIVKSLDAQTEENERANVQSLLAAQMGVSVADLRYVLAQQQAPQHTDYLAGLEESFNYTQQGDSYER